MHFNKKAVYISYYEKIYIHCHAVGFAFRRYGTT